MTKPAPAQYKTTSWRDYNAAFKARGSLLIWLDPAMQWYAINLSNTFSVKFTTHHLSH